MLVWMEPNSERGKFCYCAANSATRSVISLNNTVLTVIQYSSLEHCSVCNVLLA